MAGAVEAVRLFSYARPMETQTFKKMIACFGRLPLFSLGEPN